jgi:hypothetical protein
MTEETISFKRNSLLRIVRHLLPAAGPLGERRLESELLLNATELVAELRRILRGDSFPNGVEVHADRTDGALHQVSEGQLQASLDLGLDLCAYLLDPIHRELCSDLWSEDRQEQQDVLLRELVAGEEPRVALAKCASDPPGQEVVPDQLVREANVRNRRSSNVFKIFELEGHPGREGGSDGMTFLKNRENAPGLPGRPRANCSSAASSKRPT